MAGMDYCYWGSTASKCWYEPIEWKCSFHKAFLAGDAEAMKTALSENDQGRLPNGVRITDAEQLPDGSWQFTIIATPDVPDS